MRTPRPQNRRAFTLIEVLVATMMLATLVGALYAVFYSAIRLREHAYAAVEAGMPRDMFAGILRRDLSNMVVPNGVLAGEFSGETAQTADSVGDMITFYTTTGVITTATPWGDIQKVEYALMTPEDGDDSKGYDLVRSVTRNLTTTTVDTDEDIQDQTLVHGVEDMVVDYWDGTAWLDEWASTDYESQNPKAVRVVLSFYNPDDAEHFEPPLTIVVPIVPQPRPTPADTGDTSSGDESGA